MSMIFTDLTTKLTVLSPSLTASVTPDSQADQGDALTGIYARFGKSILDILLVIALAPIALPLVAATALVLMLQGASPFYSQDRIGRGGRVFRMWKLRSMVPNAEALLQEHLDSDPEARREWDERQKLARDPRITRFGQFLRKTSLDELPQLWNVFRGDMSIVGPRPMMVDQQSLYPGVAYYALRPGITGSWQVSDRHRSSFAARASYDQSYLSTLSLTRDIAILVRTAIVVVRGTGC